MNKRVALWSFFVVMMLCCCFSCQTKLDDFVFTYSLESPGNYKIQVSFDDQKNYKVERYNYFMDNFARRRDPKILEGTLSDGEFEQVRAVLGEARIFDMKDSYGFEKEVSSKDMGEVLTQVYLKSEGKEKYISIRDMMNEKFPQGYIKLVKFINQFCVDHPVDE